MTDAGTSRKPDVGADAFAALDLRVGRVVAAEPFAAARVPALVLTVDFGSEVGTLTTSARIAEYDPDGLVGRLVVGAINLGSKRIAGLESQFLVLGAVPGGPVQLLGVDGDVPPGTPVA